MKTPPHRLLTIATSAHGFETSRLDACRHDVSWAAPGAHVRRRMRRARAREPSIFLSFAGSPNPRKKNKMTGK